ncbi:acyl-CoA thioesterase [Geodermatophilus sp. SYSU D00079]
MSAYRSRGVVRFSETDASGRFHFTSALRWAEDAEHETYRACGLDPAGFPRRAVTSSYLSSLRAGDEYVVELEVERVGTSSIAYRWRVLTGDVVCVEGGHTVVHVGGSGHPEPVPDVLRTELEGRLGPSATAG